jgi:hypothetical protein
MIRWLTSWRAVQEGTFTMAKVEIEEIQSQITSIGDMTEQLQSFLSKILQALQEQQQRSQLPTYGGDGPEPDVESNNAQRFDRIERALEALIMAELAQPKIDAKLEKMLIKARKRLHRKGHND